MLKFDIDSFNDHSIGLKRLKEEMKIKRFHSKEARHNPKLHRILEYRVEPNVKAEVLKNVEHNSLKPKIVKILLLTEI